MPYSTAPVLYARMHKLCSYAHLPCLEGITKAGPDGLTNGKDNKNTQKAQNIFHLPWTREGLMQIQPILWADTLHIEPPQQEGGCSVSHTPLFVFPGSGEGQHRKGLLQLPSLLPN